MISLSSRAGGLLCALLAAGAGSSAAAAERCERVRPLSSVLKDLQASGLRIVFSDALVRPSMLVVGPRCGSPRQLLDAALAPHGLEARDGADGWLMVVKARRAPVGPPAPGTSSGQAACLSLVVRTAQGTALAPKVSAPQWNLEVPAGPDGLARLSVPPGLYRIVARLGGFGDWEADGVLLEQGHEVELPVTLEPAADSPEGRRPSDGVLTLAFDLRNRHEESIEVCGSAGLAATGPAALRVAVREVEATAGAFEDVFRLLALRPGVTPVNEAQGRFSVRSAGPDQNLTLMDGVEIYNPFRSEALVSAFDPAAVESFDLTTGVMSARHGDRLASVLEVRPRPGRRDRRLQGAAALDAASTTLSLEGALPGSSAASWILYGRTRTPGNLMERLTRLDDLPSFADVYARVDWPMRGRAHLSFWTLLGREVTRDHLLHKVDNPVLHLEERLNYRAHHEAWAAVGRAAWGPRLSSTTVLSHSSNHHDASETHVFLPVYSEPRTGEWREVVVGDTALRESLVFQPSARARWEAGFELHRLDTAWGMGGKGFLLANWSLFRGPTLAPTPWGSRGEFLTGAEVMVESARDAVRTGAWLQGALALTDALTIEAGLRAEHSSINGEIVGLPRVHATWRRGPMRLSAAWGRHAQSPGFEKVILGDTFLDYGGSDRLDVSSERSRHAVVGLERDLGRHALARVELFHTRFDRLIVGHLEPAQPEEGVPERIGVSPVNDGEGTARGAEVWLRVGRRGSEHQSPAGSLAYSYSVSRRRSYGIEYPFDYDRRHALALTGALPLGRKLGLAAAWRAASGLPYTPFRPVRSGAPGQRNPGVSLADLNSARHPFYSRLDLRGSFTPGGPGGRFELYVDVFNVLNYDVVNGSNGPDFNPRVVRDSDGVPIIVERSDHGFAVVPSVGLRWRF